jgi:hypothetical protein
MVPSDPMATALPNSGAPGFNEVTTRPSIPKESSGVPSGRYLATKKSPRSVLVSATTTTSPVEVVVTSTPDTATSSPGSTTSPPVPNVESSSPSSSSRTTNNRESTCPTARIFPSDCTATPRSRPSLSSSTAPRPPKLGSGSPSAKSRITTGRSCPMPFATDAWACPTTITLPSACISSASA